MEIVTKTGNGKWDSLGPYGNLEVVICGPRQDRCCHISNLDNQNINDFERGQEDAFKGKALQNCQSFKLPWLAYMHIMNMNSVGENDDGWGPLYMDVKFHNSSKLHCDLKKFGHVKNRKIVVTDMCVLQ